MATGVQDLNQPLWFAKFDTSSLPITNSPENKCLNCKNGKTVRGKKYIYYIHTPSQAPHFLHTSLPGPGFLPRMPFLAIFSMLRRSVGRKAALSMARFAWRGPPGPPHATTKPRGAGAGPLPAAGSPEFRRGRKNPFFPLKSLMPPSDPWLTTSKFG